MPECLPQRVVYPFHANTPPIVVERLSSLAITEEYSRNMLLVTKNAYTAAIGGKLLPSALIHESLPVDSQAAIHDQQQALGLLLAGGKHQVWSAYNQVNGTLEGAITMRRGWTADMAVYVLSLVANPPHGRGVGRRLLHAALGAGGFNAYGTVELDTFEPSGIARWYERIGLRPGDRTSDMQFRTLRIRMRQFGGVPLLQVFSNLELRYPELTQAQSYID